MFESFPPFVYILTFCLLLFKKNNIKDLFFLFLYSIVIVVFSFVLFIFIKEDSVNHMNEFSTFILILLSIVNILYFFGTNEEEKLENINKKYREKYK